MRRESVTNGPVEGAFATDALGMHRGRIHAPAQSQRNRAPLVLRPVTSRSIA